jgi:hypothetical protein
VKAHPGWKSPRAALQAIRRALNYCKESGLIDSNPVKGLKVPKSGKRIAYLTPETEDVRRDARPALATHVQAYIRETDAGWILGRARNLGGVGRADGQHADHLLAALRAVVRPVHGPVLGGYWLNKSYRRP